MVRDAIATPAGRAMLGARGAGTYRVRVRRIGYAPYLSEPIAVGPRDTVAVTLRVPARRIALAPVRVTASPARCRRGDQERADAAALFDEIRIALEAAELTRADSLARTSVTMYENTIDRAGRLLDTRTREIGTAGADRGVTFYAPNAEVLLSPQFSADHCFGLVCGTGPREGLIGLSFEPVPQRAVAEIRGALWVDSSSLELRDLEFTYVRAPFPGVARGLGGRIEFEKLPSGAWLERFWSIRMPRMRAADGGAALDGYLESGARARLAESAVLAPRPVERLGVGRVVATAFDSLLGRPLRGAAVAIRTLDRRTLDRRTLADSAGRFAFEAVPRGRHEVEATHASLDTLGFAALLAEAAVSAGGTDTVALATPSFATINDGRCGDATVAVIGRVRDGRTRVPVAGATVTLEWATRMHLNDASDSLDTDGQTTITGRDGRFFACLREIHGISAHATHGPAGSERARVQPNYRRVRSIELLLRPNYRAPKLIR